MSISTTTIENTSETAIFSTMSFEELRKRARHIETEIDAKLVLFSKLASTSGFSQGVKKSQELAPLLSTDDQYEGVSKELEELLTALTDINERLNCCTVSSSVPHLHTVQRHRDILQDYRNEFIRTSCTIKARREREQLLNRPTGNGSLSGLSRRDLYLKEGEHLVNSERLVDEQISIAMDTRDHMKTQREAFKLIQTKVNDLSNRFPVINTLMTKINFRKRRDSLILGLVIGLCLTFMLWWMFF